MYIPFVFHRAAVQALMQCNLYALYITVDFVSTCQDISRSCLAYIHGINLRLALLLYETQKEYTCPAHCCIKACPLLFGVINVLLLLYQHKGMDIQSGPLWYQSRPLLYQTSKEMYKLLVCCNTHVEILLIIKFVERDFEDRFMHVPKQVDWG